MEVPCRGLAACNAPRDHGAAAAGLCGLRRRAVPLPVWRTAAGGSNLFALCAGRFFPAYHGHVHQHHAVRSDAALCKAEPCGARHADTAACLHGAAARLRRDSPAAVHQRLRTHHAAHSPALVHGLSRRAARALRRSAQKDVSAAAARRRDDAPALVRLPEHPELGFDHSAIQHGSVTAAGQNDPILFFKIVLVCSASVILTSQAT